jgi:hypothetical protein
MSYQYDVFFSYKRDRESDAWHERVRDKLVYWLRQSLNQAQVAIFLDTEDITTGNRWRMKLQSALKASKCVVCIWSPLYFKSKWCVSEWMTFEQRGQPLGLDLVAPARYYDGEFYPEPAKDRQSPDFSDYASTMPRFWETEHAVEFEKKLLRPFALDLANIIRSAPDFDPNFPIVEASDDQVIRGTKIGRLGDA